jgi:hypothetical protein
MSLAACARAAPRVAAATRLKIVVSPVRVRVSPSERARESRAFRGSARIALCADAPGIAANTYSGASPPLPATPAPPPATHAPIRQGGRSDPVRACRRASTAAATWSAISSFGWCSPSRITCHLARRARGRCLGRRRMLPTATGRCDGGRGPRTRSRVQVSSASSRHSSTRCSSLRWGGTPRFAGWSAPARPPYSRPRALRTSASNAFPRSPASICETATVGSSRIAGTCSTPEDLDALGKRSWQVARA